MGIYPVLMASIIPDSLAYLQNPGRPIAWRTSGYMSERLPFDL